MTRRTKKAAGGRRRTIEQAKKDAEALSLHCQGLGYQQIADELGWRSKSSALHAVRRALADIQRDKLEQMDHFTAAVERIQSLLRQHQDVIDRPHYAVTASGKVAMMYNPDTGQDEPVLDDGPRQRSMAEIRHLNDQMAMLMDLRPPAKSRVEVVTEDVVDREIARLAEEIAAAQKPAGKDAGAGK